MKYKIIEFAINYQRFFNSIAVVILIAGAFVYFNTPKDIFPQVREAYIQVQVVYPGASAQVIQQQIVLPIEQKISVMSEIKSSTSISRKNVGFLRFLVDGKHYKKLNEIRQLVQNSINSLSLPEGILAPQVSTTTLNDAPFIQIFIDNTNPQEAYRIANLLEKDLLHIENLEQPIIYGKNEYQYQIFANPDKLARYGVSLGEIYHAIQQSKTDIPSGEVSQDDLQKNITMILPMNNIHDLQNVVIRANELGNLIEVNDVADVTFDFSLPKSYFSLNGTNGIVFSIVKNKLGDISKLQKQLESLVNRYQTEFPDTDIQLFFDNSKQITNRIQLLNENLTIGLVFVFLVLLLFFNFSTALWTTMGVPVSFCVGLLMTVALGININTIVMISFILILGVVVDDGIVFSENAYRHLEMGKTPRQAVIDGMGEVSTSVLFAALTTIASISTQLSLSGKIGDLAYPIPIVIICTLIGSLFESIFVLPGHLLHSFEHMKVKVHNSPSWKTKFFDILQSKYQQLLRVLVYNRKKSLIGILVLVSLLTVSLFMKIPFVFYAGPPKTILVFFNTKTGTKLAQSEILAQKITGFLRGINELSDVYSISGFQNNANDVFIQAEIKPSIDPTFNWLTVKEDLKKYIKDNDLAITNFRFNVMGEDNFYVDKLEITVQGTNQKAVLKLAQSVQKFIQTQDNIDNPRLNVSDPIYNLDVTANPRKSKTYGITPREIAQNVSIAYEGATVSQIHNNEQSYDIRLQYDPQYHTFTSLTNMRIPNKFARFVKLSEMIDINTNFIDKEIFTENGLFSVKVVDSLYQTSILSNNSLQIIDNIKSKFSKYTNDNLDVSLSFENEISEVVQGVNDISSALFLGIAFVLLILLYLFNSFISTFLALAGIPFILFGLTLGLYIMKLPLNNMAMLGLIALLGLVVNDAIVLLEHLYATLQKGKLFLNDLIANVSTRFRPIMMTLTTTLVGVAPLAFGFAGDEVLLQPLAVVIFFGALVVSLITLVVLPLIISILEVDCKGLFFKYYRSSVSTFFGHIRNLFLKWILGKRFQHFNKGH